MNDLVREIGNEQLKTDLPNVGIGNTIKVHIAIIEGEKQRVQIYNGVVIAMKGTGISKTITVRRIAYGVASEKIFPLNAPTLRKIEIVARGKVKRSKLYFLRNLSGKAARLKEIKR